ncbi:MAG: hypothetical protein V1775_01815 [Bacteroidota bacterium]
MKIALISLITLLLLMTACKKESLPLPEAPDVINGCRINPQYDDSVVVYGKAPALVEGSGFRFGENESLKEHKNAGWCGTPPITYGDFKGTYSVNDSIIAAAVGYWGGTTGYTRKLLSPDQESLTFKLLNVVYIPG